MCGGAVRQGHEHASGVAAERAGHLGEHAPGVVQYGHGVSSNMGTQGLAGTHSGVCRREHQHVRWVLALVLALCRDGYRSLIQYGRGHRDGFADGSFAVEFLQAGNLRSGDETSGTVRGVVQVDGIFGPRDIQWEYVAECGARGVE